MNPRRADRSARVGSAARAVTAVLRVAALAVVVLLVVADPAAAAEVSTDGDTLAQAGEDRGDVLLGALFATGLALTWLVVRLERRRPHHS